MNEKRRITYTRRGKRHTVPSPDYSNLPDDILADILQRLSIRDAVRTTVLSSKWKDKWMTVQQLIFDENYCKPTSRKEVLTDEFAAIVDNVLTQHRGKISKFKLSVINHTDESGRNCIRRWIVLLAKKNIQDLTIEACYYSVRCDSLIACEKLSVLKLKGGILEVPRSKKVFKNLKELWLERIIITEKDLKKLLSKCPLLEKLTIIKIPVHLVEIDVKTVKYLHVQVIGDYRIINAKSVTNLSIQHVGASYNNFSSISTDSSKLSDIFSRLPKVEKLEVSFYCLQFLALGGVPVKLPNILNGLRDMSVGICFEDADAISTVISLLRSAPNLERLKISVKGLRWLGATDLSRPTDIFWRKEREYSFYLDHLKGVRVEQPSATESEVEFILYLLENSRKLETFTVDGKELIRVGQ